MKDLITIDQLSLQDVNKIHDLAQKFFQNKKNSSLDNQDSQILKDKILVNFFFENSTRTRTSFEIAAKRLGAEVVNIDVAVSSLKKGESVADSVKTITAMNPDFVAIRHSSSGILQLFKQHINLPLINAGDGTNEHPSQALLDLFTIRQHKDLQNLKVAICGDILHSRVARSNIKLLKKFGCKINLIMPPTLIAPDYANWAKANFDAEVFDCLDEGIKNVDVIMMLRIQRERMSGCYIPSLAEYFKIFGLNKDRLKLAKDDVLVMHPGPVNRDVEICSSIVDNEDISLILEQVEAGVSVRQAILQFLC